MSAFFCVALALVLVIGAHRLARRQGARGACACGRPAIKDSDCCHVCWIAACCGG